MTRKLASLALVLVLAACAHQAAPPPSNTPNVPIPRTPPRGEPDQFSGISVDRLQVLLGSPAFIRKDGATEMWRYDTATPSFCTAPEPIAKVRHIETVPQGKGIAASVRLVLMP